MGRFSIPLITTPPKTSRVMKESGELVNFADIIDSFGNALDPFGHMQVAEYTPIIELKSTYGISVFRDIVDVDGSGTVLHNLSEYQLSTEEDGDIASLKSAEKRALSATELPSIDMPSASKVTLAARAVSGTATLDAVLKVREEW